MLQSAGTSGDSMSNKFEAVYTHLIDGGPLLRHSPQQVLHQALRSSVPDLVPESRLRLTGEVFKAQQHVDDVVVCVAPSAEEAFASKDLKRNDTQGPHVHGWVSCCPCHVKQVPLYCLQASDTDTDLSAGFMHILSMPRAAFLYTCTLDGACAHTAAAKCQLSSGW